MLECINPLVTIVTLIYDTKSKYIIDTITSIKNNSYPNIEHIIIDDFSKDLANLNQIKDWIKENEYNCYFIENDKNLGICKNLNIALNIAKGKYMIICCDDILLSNAIKIHIDVFENLDDSYTLTFGDVYFIDSKNKRFGSTFIKNQNKFDFVPEEYVFEYLIDGIFIPIMGVMFKVENLKIIGGFDEKLDYEDFDIFLRLSRVFKFKYLYNIIAEYRRHENNFSEKYTFHTKVLIDSYVKHIDDTRISNNFQLYNQNNLILEHFFSSKVYFDFFRKSKQLMFFLNSKKIIINSKKYLISNYKMNWYEAIKLGITFKNKYRLMSIKELENFCFFLDVSIKYSVFWSFNDGYGFYSWCYYVNKKQSFSCLRDNKFFVILIKG
jgi:glycosyltransferase involved in cell wall biosynthesis